MLSKWVKLLKSPWVLCYHSDVYCFVNFCILLDELRELVFWLFAEGHFFAECFIQSLDYLLVISRLVRRVLS